MHFVPNLYHNVHLIKKAQKKGATLAGNPLKLMVRGIRFELMAFASGGQRSIQLS